MKTARTTHAALLAGLFGLLAAVPGCKSAVQMANCPTGIPLARVPDCYLVRPKAEMIDISLGSLRQDKPENYTLDAGDVLGVYIQTILGEQVIGEGERIPVVHYPTDPSKPPIVGHPIPVRENGTISVPVIAPFSVKGMTLVEVEEAIREKYEDRMILKEGKDRITVDLIKPRTYRILVVREEEGGAEGIAKRGTGHVVDLEAGDNDLLHALNATGGLPGIDAKNEIVIYHGQFADAAHRNAVLAQINSCQKPCCWKPPKVKDAQTTIVPLRYYPENVPRLKEEDVILQTGDIVMIQSRDEERYYTSGLLGGGEHLLPRDRDLDVMQAIAQSGGALAPGSVGFGGGGGGGGGLGGGGGRGGGSGVLASQVIVLRKTDCGGQIPIRLNLNDMVKDPRQRILVKAGDVIILRYTIAEEVTNAALGLVGFNFLLGNGLRR